MISKFFILSFEGIVLVEKDFRQELPENTLDIFIKEFFRDHNQSYVFY